VAQDIASHPGLGALLGQVHFNIERALGCVGIVTNGAVRSLPTAEALGFQIFAGNVSVSHAYTHIVEFGTPVEVDGLKVHSGELLHGDQHGVQSIPISLAAQLPAVAARITAKKQAIIALCQSPEFTLEKLRAVVAKK
jgi:regulator of RNase E activity RraA